MDWQSLIKTIAPWIGTALGGPLGGMAVTAVADAFGLSDKTADAVKSALQGVTPEQMLALKKADQDFAAQMQQMGFTQLKDMESLAVADRDSARKMQIAAHSVVPAFLTWFIVAGFTTVLVMLFIKDVPVANRDIIVYMCGQLSGFTAAAVAFWLGTTRESATKTDMIANSDAVKPPASVPVK